MSRPGEKTAAMTALGLTIAQGRSADELALLGQLFTLLGDVLSTISIEKEAAEAAGEQTKQKSPAKPAAKP